MKYDYIIVGQGMAGSMLAWFLQRENKSVLIIDNSNPASASNVGAGIIHPVTGRRIVKTWMADDLVPFARHTYRELGNIFGEEFFQDLPVLELLSTVRELNDWQSRTESAEMHGYIDGQNKSELYEDVLKPFAGKIQVNQTGWVDMQKLVQVFREYFVNKAALLDEEFVQGELKLERSRVLYKHYEAAQIIFCEGYAAMQNPLWNHLPFLPAKGEIITIESQQLNLNHILSRSIFILPIGNNRYRVGSNYEWNDLSETPTEAARERILKQLEEIIDVPYKVIAHTAGIRPSVKDRRPFLGLHHHHKQAGISNGLGTKGALLAPFFANHFAGFLVHGNPLMKETDIAFRFPA
jgi:glycine oxidase